MENTTHQPGNKNEMNIPLSYRTVCIILVATILAMLALWRPWVQRAAANDRTIEVAGQTTVTAVPDEYVFNPMYEFKNTDRQAALVAMARKSDETVAKLKELGIDANKIKTNSDGYDAMIYRDSTTTPTYMLRLTVTVANKELSQKVQDYLLTTSPTGSISPVVTISETLRNQLETDARNKATQDARSKAEQSAKNLKFRLASVKEVKDGSGFNNGDSIMPMEAKALAVDGATGSAASSMTVQPGENKLQYSVSVTYYIR